MSSVAAPILLTVLMAFVVLGAAGLQQTHLGLAQATTRAAAVTAERARTRIEVVTASAGGTTVQVELLNSGGVTIADYAAMDAVVDYQGATGRVATRLTFTQGAPQPGQWRVSGIWPDALHPGLWNPAETLTLTLTLPQPIAPGGTAAVILGTPNGQTVSTYVTDET